MSASKGWSIRVAVIAATWHSELVGRAVEGFEMRFRELESESAQIERFTVPGAFEIPLHAQRLARTGRFDAIAACAFVVDGGIYRHEFVASSVLDGLMQVQLSTDVPVFSAVLTPHIFHEHAEHIAYFSRHLELKGQELAEAVSKTVRSLRTIDNG